MEREAAREAVLARKRQWETVGGSDDDEAAAPSGAAARDASPSRKRARKDEKKKKKKDAKKKKKDKKKAKKKDKKKDKKKKKKKKKTAANAGACDQDRWGKYGIVRESDYFRKTREFEAWCGEIKKIPAFTGSKRDLMELFLEYAEDYNTATLPHEKFYDLDAWEMAEMERKRRGEASKKRGAVQSVFDDEALVAAEQKRARDARDAEAEAADTRATASRMSADTRKEFQRLEVLKQEQQAAYKRGDLETVRRLDRQLKPVAEARASGPPPPFS